MNKRTDNNLYDVNSGVHIFSGHFGSVVDKRTRVYLLEDRRRLVWGESFRGRFAVYRKFVLSNAEINLFMTIEIHVRKIAISLFLCLESTISLLDDFFTALGLQHRYLFCLKGKPSTTSLITVSPFLPTLITTNDISFPFC